MKKFISLILAALLAITLLTSCSGSKSSQTATAPSYSGELGSSSSSQSNDLAPDKSTVTDNGNALTDGSITASLAGDKIIYNYSATVETTKFDESVKNVGVLLEKYGAFIESSYISGISYGAKTYKTADYTLRVPVGNFKSLTGSLSLLGNVLNENTTSQNITAQFIDTESRLNAYKTEESRLLDMLNKASTVTDMITIEQRLSDVRYQIESLTSTLKNWQNQVDFSTVTLHIQEVAQLTEQLSVQRTYWERLWDGVKATFRGIGDFFKEFFMIFVVILPVLVLLCIIAAAILIIIRSVRKRRLRKSAKDDEPKK